MKYTKILLMLISFFITGCGDTPIFTEMSTNRLKVVIKGTFETDGVSQFVEMKDYELDLSNPVFQDDSVDDVTAGSHDVLPTTFMFDIAELGLNGVKFANYRQIIEASLSGGNTLASEPEPFFNGTGVLLKSDDPGAGNYQVVQLYIRKMVFDSAMIYGNGMVYEKPSTVIFFENDRNGFDFNQLQTNTHWDSLRLEGSSIFRNFPLVIPIIGGLQYSMENAETILEIRIVVKNFIKKYEYDYYDEGVFKVCHYYAFSDWLRDIRSGEKSIGGNIHAVARSYIPGKTGSIDVGATAGSYVIAIPSSEDINDYVLTNPGSVIRNTNNCNFPKTPPYPGLYIDSMLDFYLKYEKYKDDFNSILLTCPDLDTYEAEWDLYENTLANYRIPPYVVAEVGGVARFIDMAPGTYEFYEVLIPSLYGDLLLSADFDGGAPTKITGADVTISIGVNPPI